ncbi:nucleoside-diphosphate sugar epimerase/dehydratase [Sphaerochaeta sp. PS]|uniref:polysaccharide biosynthesis protein n=1 Tax=Sphaerochaeta sp. PS TaxID=3076336 RepID=UPI0028A45BF7|nr:nucleoside-diphosphate sugar epimerase/dehydratase [Sphaerochaeta sp. PS]MDT4763357.1 nucleoside-diphosphate sugar epimerase/dehydratase [Sphaerochaeta sp. PS]
MARLSTKRIRRLVVLLCFDAVWVIASGFFAAWVVFRTIPPSFYSVVAINTISLLVVLKLVRFYAIRISESSLDLLNRGLPGFALPLVVGVLIFARFDSFASLWIPFLCVADGFAFLFLMGLRYLYRSALNFHLRHTNNGNPRTIVYGAGELGNTLVRQYQKGRLPFHIVGFVDDDPALHGTYLLGLKVFGPVEVLGKALQQTQAKTLIIAITEIEQERMLLAVDAAKENNCNVMVIPSLFEMQQTGAKELDLRSLDYADLLGRPLIKIDREPIRAMVRDKRILVTGAGGSIGSEICKQLLSYDPKQLVLLDIDETELHDLSLRLHNYQKEWSSLVVPVVCDIKNRKKIDRIFEQYRPELVFHAAAYKHVPLQELYPEEAINTNIGGSFNILQSAKAHKTRKVVVISTDKAVNPTNVMGATKRVVELMASMLNSVETEMVAVRFGNVLGSRGSMLPLFMDQIKAGVPITVTHREIIRYFMAIPEAVGLVFKAASMAKGGEVMVLDMGQPVKIYDFAQKLVKYYGDGRSQVIVTGLRPGEKLYEELLANKDTTIPTEDKLVFKAKVDNTKLIEEDKLKELIDSLTEKSPQELVKTLHELVPEFEGTRV